jgi:energy-converting hydrogenase Eha subunit E
MRSICICVIKLLLILKSLSWSLKRFLKIFDVNVTQTLRSFVVWYSFQILFYLKFNNFFNVLLMSLFSSKMIFSFFAHNLLNHFRLRSFNVSFAVRRLRSRAIVSLRLILLQCVFVKTLCFFSCNFIRVFVCSSVKCNSMNDICVSTSKNWWKIVLNASQTMRKLYFCKSMRFLMNFMNEFERSCDACHVLNSYVIIDLTIAVYTCLVFLKQTFHVDAMKRVNANICVVIFSWIFLTYESYLNLISNCTFNIFIEINDFLMILLMLIIVVMLKRRWFFIKCINSYLIDAKRASYCFAHSSHSTWAFFNALQLFFVLVS